MPFRDETDGQTYRLAVSEVGAGAAAEALRHALLPHLAPLEAQLARWVERGPTSVGPAPSEVTVHLRFDGEGSVAAVDVSGAAWRAVVALGLFGVRLSSQHARLEATIRLRVEATREGDGPTRAG